MLVPLLLILFPSQSPEIITGISLAVVFFNALSGSVTYARMKRIDYKSGLLFSSATVPGAILGALSTKYIPHHWFNVTFGLLLLAIAIYLFISPERTPSTTKADTPQGHIQCRIAGPNGAIHTFSYDPRLGIVLSLAVGYLSSLLGIGGGIIHVPVLVNFLNFPVHIATATSHFILAVTAFAATVVHVWTGTLQHEVGYTLCLAVGVLFGAPVGAWLSNRLHGKWIIRGLALALVLVGVRLLVMATT